MNLWLYPLILTNTLQKKISVMYRFRWQLFLPSSFPNTSLICQSHISIYTRIIYENLNSPLLIKKNGHIRQQKAQLLHFKWFKFRLHSVPSYLRKCCQKLIHRTRFSKSLDTEFCFWCEKSSHPFASIQETPQYPNKCRVHKKQCAIIAVLT